jgi:hypothetical protein
MEKSKITILKKSKSCPRESEQSCTSRMLGSPLPLTRQYAIKNESDLFVKCAKIIQ